MHNLFASLFSTSHKSIRCTNVQETVDSYLIAEKAITTNAPLLVLTSDQKECERILAELESITDLSCAAFPAGSVVPYNMRSPFGPIQEARLSLLKDLLNGSVRIVVAPTAALFEKTMKPQDLFRSIIRINVDDTVELEDLSEWLVNSGFRREPTVADPGSFALRGGIVDIYPFGADNPLRIEFWGDTVESIREFDIFRQSSLKQVSSIEILPMKEFIPSDDQRDDALDLVEEFCKEKKYDDRHFDVIEHGWSNISEADGLEWFRHWYEDIPSGSLLEYLPSATEIIWTDYLTLNERHDRETENYHNHLARVPELQRPFVSSPEQLLIPITTLIKGISDFSTLYTKAGIDAAETFHFDFITQVSFGGDLPLFINDIETKRSQGYTIEVVAETDGHKSRLEEQFTENDLTPPTVRVGTLTSGFFSAEKKIAIYSEAKLFDRSSRRKFITKSRQTAPLINFDAFTRDDIVVHVDHGLGKYKGITAIKAGNDTYDCMIIEYREGAKIHVPLTDFHKVQKYIGRDGVPPQLSKLGSSAWEKKKEKTRRDLQEMASQLIKLYAQREFSKGIQMDEDSSWQKEFEDAFPYTPTPDQVTSMEKIKFDLESSRPMDRLVCGDVGFGKTEVAMRAAFKAVMAGYQVAVLAPTTVLASQHVKNFRARMAEFPVNISGLSRLTNSGSATRIKSDLHSGELNILVGTHKILSKSIKYKNLGLVIIDEEQRFGVKQKERFTELRHSINVLSMSATPIPRTLHMSMAGIRDLSLIATPPRNRLPIETTVAESHDDLIQQALQDELDRGGQSFVVYNRIAGLEELYRRVERLIPTAKIAFAHGQMEGDEIEAIMNRFTAGEYNILIATTIIENGIDISNANTIIVEGSDKLGLSQLYQLRGRVGRSGEQAFAYFLVKSLRNVNENSLKRLKALEQYTDLGSGFQLAMRDLELRGAGNLLGTDQSGSIAQVGFELYCQLLNEEITRLRARGKEDSVAKDPEIELKLQGHFPANYIPDSNLRIQLYQRCTALAKLGELKLFSRELSDRFGALPEDVAELLLYMEIKILAKRFYIEKLSLEESKVTLTLGGSDESVRETTARFMGLKDGNFSLKYDDKVKMITKIPDGDSQHKCSVLKNILKKLLRTEVKK